MFRTVNRNDKSLQMGQTGQLNEFFSKLKKTYLSGVLFYFKMKALLYYGMQFYAGNIWGFCEWADRQNSICS